MHPQLFVTDDKLIKFGTNLPKKQTSRDSGGFSYHHFHFSHVPSDVSRVGRERMWR